MKKIITFVIPIVTVIFTSCVTSLHPITENENDLVFKKELLGNWIDKDSARYIIEETRERGGKSYYATVIDPKKSSQPANFSDTSYFIISLASVKGKLFLDCVADMKKFENRNLGGSAVSSVMPTHFIVPVISIRQNAIELSPLDHDKLLALLNQGKFKMKNEIVNNDDILFTEKPKNLQQKLMELENFPAVFGKAVLKRATN
ncbi:MAG TPA: hypothetical protein VGQ53_23165 [Chitinophagaceae bacterium]|jgi:hypothetical protein|nr:hypothetical protein [Chitinophagaceae bacterium]